MGEVRAILWQHLYIAGGRVGMPPPQVGCNALVPASDFAAALQEHADQADPRAAAHAYVALWQRTFTTLVRQLRGHPDRMLRLFVEEVYPYLRGTRLAGRVEQAGPRRARVLLDGDLPAAYCAGLLEAFAGLAGATAHATTVAPGTFEVSYRLGPRELGARWVTRAARVRVPFLITSLLAAAVGVAVARSAGPLPLWPALAVLVGALAAQAGANGLHDLIAGRTQPFRLVETPRWWLWFQTLGSYAVATGALAYLLPRRPGLLLFAVVGLAVALLWRAGSGAGWGPAAAGLTAGPLLIAGANYALGGQPGPFVTPAFGLAVVLPTGALAAALVYLDDMADRPLDEAAGRRTLVVRLPSDRHVWGLWWLLAAASAGLAAVTGICAYYAPTLGWPLVAAAALTVLLGANVVGRVRTMAHRLADAPHVRPMLLATYVLAATTMALSLWVIGRTP